MIPDLRLALRQLVSAPGFSLAVILTLALGIGVNTAVFSMLDGFLLRQMPYPQPDRLAALVVHMEGFSARFGKMMFQDDDSFSGSSWKVLKENVDALTFASYGLPGGVNLRSNEGGVRYVRAGRVSAQYFEVLGIPLFRGRSFTADEDRPHGAPVVVLGNALWNSMFHADQQIIGKSIFLKANRLPSSVSCPPLSLRTGRSFSQPCNPRQPESVVVLTAAFWSASSPAPRGSE